MCLRFAATFFLFKVVCSAIVQLPTSVNSIAISPTTSSNTTTVKSSSLPSDPCNGWIMHGDQCYFVSKTFEYFDTAEKHCQAQKAHLASVSTKEENDFLYTLVRKSTRYSEAWIGYKYNTKKYIYEWIDGTKTSYKNWIYKKPGPEGYCVEIIPGGKWNNLLCTNQLQYICEKPLKTAPKSNKKVQVIILVSIPLSCVFLMTTFVAYLWIRSVHQMSLLPPEEHKNPHASADAVEIPALNTTVEKPTTPSLQDKSIDAEKSDAMDQTAMQLYRKISAGKAAEYTTIRDKDGIYRKVTLV